MKRHSEEMILRARALRKDMTPQERKLWYLFLRNYPVRFSRQKLIDSFIADFYCASAELVIELDGAQHHIEENAEYDNIRTGVLEERGLFVLRFDNSEVDYEFSKVCGIIENTVRKRMEKRGQAK